jgi:hypothetical protein
MTGPLLPSDLLTEVIQSLVATNRERSHWLSLRLVNRRFHFLHGDIG